MLAHPSQRDPVKYLIKQMLLFQFFCDLDSQPVLTMFEIVSWILFEIKGSQMQVEVIVS